MKPDQAPQLPDLLNHWLNLEPDYWEGQWRGDSGAQLREDINRKPWQRSDFALDRSLLEQAIARLHIDPADWAAQLVLRALGRRYDLVPAPPAWLDGWLSASVAGLLTILPPLPSHEITVLIPTYNRVAKLERAVRSVITQSHTDWKLLIVDDGSTDGTTDYCRGLEANDKRIRYLPKAANSGLADSWDLLCREAQTELIIGLADDDSLMPMCLEATLALFRRFPWIAAAGGGYYQLHRKQGQLMAKQYGPYYAEARIADTRLELQRCGIVNPLFGAGQLLRRSALAAVSTADPGLGEHRYSCWDWLSTNSLLARYEVGYTPEIVCAYLDEADTPNTFGMDWGEGLLGMLEQLIGNYHALFGPDTYPPAIARYFLEVVAEPALVSSFHKVLNQHETAEEMDDYLLAQRPVWERHRVLNREVIPRLTAPSLLDEHTTSGLTSGNIPGLATGQAPRALQILLQSLLKR